MFLNESKKHFDLRDLFIEQEMLGHELTDVSDGDELLKNVLSEFLITHGNLI